MGRLTLYTANAGTSACPHGIFYCLNKGHKEKYLTSAFVDDGICGTFRRLLSIHVANGRFKHSSFAADCCDGTDELSGCTNTCLKKNAVVREGLQQKIEEYKLSLHKKKEILDSAAKKKSHIVSRLGSIDKEISDKTVEIDQWAGKHPG
jgi:protein kinase C substrate 80K-H